MSEFIDNSRRRYNGAESHYPDMSEAVWSILRYVQGGIGSAGSLRIECGQLIHAAAESGAPHLQAHAWDIIRHIAGGRAQEGLPLEECKSLVLQLRTRQKDEAA